MLFIPTHVDLNDQISRRDLAKICVLDALRSGSSRVAPHVPQRFRRDERPRAAEDVKSAAPKRRGGDSSIIITVHQLVSLRPRLGGLVLGAPDRVTRRGPPARVGRATPASLPTLPCAAEVVA